MNPDAALIAACERHPTLLAAWSAELGSTNDKAIWSGQGPAGIAYDASQELRLLRRRDGSVTVD